MQEHRQLLTWKDKIDDTPDAIDIKACRRRRTNEFSAEAQEMITLLNYPLVIFVVALVTMYFAKGVGASLGKRRGDLRGEDREYFNLITPAFMTLLALIIGFTFSMAISRYDQRKNCEEAEASAIGTEYLRADLLPAADTARVRTLLVNYLDQRILFYNTRYESRLKPIDAATAQLETELWSAVMVPAVKNPTFLTPLAVSGMNDVLNSREDTQAAWWNRVPKAAWWMMEIIAIFTNVLIGYGLYHIASKKVMRLVFPLVISVAFFLIADIDSPRGGVIHVSPADLISLAHSLQAKD